MENNNPKHTYEKNIIVDLVSKCSSIIGNKKSDRSIIKKKECTWIQITNEFNSHLNAT